MYIPRYIIHVIALNRIVHEMPNYIFLGFLADRSGKYFLMSLHMNRLSETSCLPIILLAKFYCKKLQMWSYKEACRHAQNWRDPVCLSQDHR